MNVENTGSSNEGQREVASGRSGPNMTLIGLGIVIVLFVVFFLQNSEHVVIDFLFFEKRTTIRWSLLVAVVLGILSDRVFTVWWRRRRSRPNV
ncbi:MAG TPA: hypothetical protein VGC84_06610 [Ilumatobacteraceae bacterium]|jgi:uncharacterized integral membrane protein